LVDFPCSYGRHSSVWVTLSLQCTTVVSMMRRVYSSVKYAYIFQSIHHVPHSSPSTSQYMAESTMIQSRKQHDRHLQSFVRSLRKILSTLQPDSFRYQTRPPPHGVRRFKTWEKSVPKHQSIRRYSMSDTCMHWTLSLKTDRRSYQDGSLEPRRLRMSYATPPWNYI